jgi:lysophospholipase L1-like esterase
MRKLTMTFILLSLVWDLSSQNFHVEIPAGKEIDYSYNKLQIPGKDSSRMNTFFQKFDSLYVFGTGKINILHIGGSHIQADFISNQIRRNLDDINRGYKPSRGYIFPFNVAKTNNPSNYTVKYNGKWNAVRTVQRNREIPVGMNGIAVYTNDPEAEITVNLNTDESDTRWNFNELQLLGYADGDDESVRPVLKYDDSTFIEARYDSITKTYRYSLPEPAGAFTICIRQEGTSPQTFYLHGFIPRNDEEGIVYHSIGLNGASVNSYLQCENFEDEMSLIQPDLVIFEIGVNDAISKDFNEKSFIDSYNMLIEKIERVSPGCSFIFITNNDSYKRVSRRKYAVNKNGLIAQKAFFRLAEIHKGGVWDLFSVMGGLGSMPKWEKSGLAKIDKVHFTREGYTLIGNLFYNALMNYYLKNEIE